MEFMDIILILFAFIVFEKVVALTSISTSAYIHIPFCRRRCHYCSFPIVAIGNSPDRISRESDVYTKVLLEDISLQLKLNPSLAAPLETVYFGGGTPSLLDTDCLARILKCLSDSVGLARDCEVTLEADPGTFDSEYLETVYSLGVNRLSVGVQSFNEEILRTCGRSHSRVDVTEALENISRSGFRDNFNLDLIGGLPGQTVATWEESLELALASRPAHLSVYDLQVEAGTVFGRLFTPGVEPLPSEQATVEMYHRAVACLSQAGYEHYEISNYALPGRRSRHNENYWKCRPFWGFGMGAASFLRGRRFCRPQTMKEYVSYVDQLATELETKKDSCGSVVESAHDHPLDAAEYLMTRLRTSDGVNLRELLDLFGNRFNMTRVVNILRGFENDGLVQFRDVSDESSGGAGESVVRLSDPQGFLLSNQIISSIFAGMKKI